MRYINADLINVYGKLTYYLPKFENFITGRVLRYITITEDIEFREDLISMRAYGTIDNSDIIMYFNKIDHPKQLVAGRTLAIPELK